MKEKNRKQVLSFLCLLFNLIAELSFKAKQIERKKKKTYRVVLKENEMHVLCDIEKRRNTTTTYVRVPSGRVTIINV